MIPSKDEIRRGYDQIAGVNNSKLADAIDPRLATYPDNPTQTVRTADLIAASDFIRAHAAPVGEAHIDEIMSRIYRRFKDWSQRKFSADDVTWCEVRADILAILSRHLPAGFDAGVEANVVYCAICIGEGSKSDITHIFSTAALRDEFCQRDDRVHVTFDYLVDHPERLEGKSQ